MSEVMYWDKALNMNVKVSHQSGGHLRRHSEDLPFSHYSRVRSCLSIIIIMMIMKYHTLPVSLSLTHTQCVYSYVFSPVSLSQYDCTLQFLTFLFPSVWMYSVVPQLSVSLLERVYPDPYLSALPQVTEHVLVLQFLHDHDERCLECNDANQLGQEGVRTQLWQEGRKAKEGLTLGLTRWVWQTDRQRERQKGKDGHE